MGTLRIDRTDIRRVQKTYSVEVVASAHIVIPAEAHQFGRSPFLYQLYVDDAASGYPMLWECPASRYGYNTEQAIVFDFFDIDGKTPLLFTGTLVLTSFSDAPTNT
jgi:hypothetical protein